jgi:hypothetical protein
MMKKNCIKSQPIKDHKILPQNISALLVFLFPSPKAKIRDQVKKMEENTAK